MKRSRWAAAGGLLVLLCVAGLVAMSGPGASAAPRNQSSATGTVADWGPHRCLTATGTTPYSWAVFASCTGNSQQRWVVHVVGGQVQILLKGANWLGRDMCLGIAGNTAVMLVCGTQGTHLNTARAYGSWRVITIAGRRLTDTGRGSQAGWWETRRWQNQRILLPDGI